MGFIGKNLGKVKGLSFFFPPFLHGFFKKLLWSFNRYKEWIIQLD